MHTDADTAVGDMMERWPATIRVFMRHRMGCIGCPIAPFHSVSIACDEHELPLEPFLMELAAAIEGEN